MLEFASNFAIFFINPIVTIEKGLEEVSNIFVIEYCID